MDESTSKACKRCEQVKALEEFNRARSRPDGRQAECRECQNARNREYYEANKHRLRARKDVPEERRRSREYYAKNREVLREKQRAYREENREKILAGQARYRSENREKMLAYHRSYFSANRARVIENAIRWAKENPERYADIQQRRRSRLANAETGPTDLIALWVDQGGICPLCGVAIDEGLKWPNGMSRSLDHIIPIARGGGHTQENLQWTHLRCNISKGARMLD